MLFWSEGLKILMCFHHVEIQQAMNKLCISSGDIHMPQISNRGKRNGNSGEKSPRYQLLFLLLSPIPISSSGKETTHPPSSQKKTHQQKDIQLKDNQALIRIKSKF